MGDDFKSPLPKKLKDDPVNKLYALEPNLLYSKAIFVQKLQNEVKDLADKCLSMEQDLVRLKLENLEKFTEELPPIEKPDIDRILKDLEVTMEGLKTSSKSDKALRKKAFDNMMLLKMLEAKRNCPISQIVDNI